MTTLEHATYSPDDLVKYLKTSVNVGITEDEALTRLKTVGLNQLTMKEIHWYNIFLKQFQSSFIYMLIAASLLALILGELPDSIAIAIFILINAILGFYQEFKSEQALKMLKSYIVVQAKVIRDGVEKNVDTKSLVPGDVIILETGDVIPADIRLIQTNNLTVDESVLSGESVAVTKTIDKLDKAPGDIYAAHNLLFTGTTVVNGKGVGIVIATGKNSSLGSIATLTLETDKQSGFAKGIARFSKFILRLIIVTLVFVFVANMAFKPETSLAELTMFSIALAVSVIPEALPLVMTLSLSRGALRLAKKKVVIRRLSAIEDLGGIEILCTDKTGTITENKLTAVNYYGNDQTQLNTFANLAGQSLAEKTEPFDIALWNLIDSTLQNEIQTASRLFETPFDPIKRRNNAVVTFRNLTYTITRGAAENIIPLCKDLDPAAIENINGWLKDEGVKGHRTLAVAFHEIKKFDSKRTPAHLEDTLTFAGIVSFVDPIKSTTVSALQKAKELGIQVKIITGDSREVAGAVGKEIGLIDDASDVINGEDFINLPFEEQQTALDQYHVFARVTPEIKYEIIQKLQLKHEIGYLGEGINDAPALKAAGVSLVVPSASGIAREAADIALLDNDLGVIVDGIHEGRAVFTNTIKYLKSTLGSNFGNFYAVAIGSLLISFLPMLPLQILLLNLLSDFPMIAIATDNVDAQDVKKPLKYNVRDVVIISTILGIVSSVFDFMFFGLFYLISPAVLQTNWFIGSILTELAFTYSVRTRLPFYAASRPSTIIMVLTAIGAIVTVVIPFTAIGINVFKFTPPTAGHLSIIFTLVVLYFACTEIVKHFYYKYAQNAQ